MNPGAQYKMLELSGRKSNHFTVLHKPSKINFLRINFAEIQKGLKINPPKDRAKTIMSHGVKVSVARGSFA